MNLRALITLLLLLPLGVCAQQFTDATVIGGLGGQGVNNIYHDNIGNKYVLLFSDKPITIDSSGTPITITSNSREYALIKYSNKNKYLHHISIKRVWPNSSFVVSFTSQNDLLLSCSFNHRDTIELYHSNRLLYKQLIIRNGTPPLARNIAVFITKISSSGQFLWTSFINKLNANYTQQGAIEVGVYCHSDTAIYVSFSSDQLTNSIDTILVTNNTNQSDTIFSNKVSIIVKLNQQGKLLTYIEPLKSLKHFQQDSALIRTFKIAKINNNIYFVLNATITTPDSIVGLSQTTPIDTGTVYLLFKMNLTDSIVWAKEIVVNHTGPQVQYPIIDLSSDTVNNHLLLAIDFDPYRNEMKLFSSNASFGTYLSKIDEQGNPVWSEFLNNIRYPTYKKNYTNKQSVLIGETVYPNGYFQHYLPYNQLGIRTTFIAFQDSMNRFFNAQSIHANQVTFSSTLSISSISISPNGKVAVGGSFLDSISLPCRTIQATLDYNNYGQKLSDGFLLEYSPILAIDTAVCKRMISPSGKYTWDSTAYYFDTIPNKLGCDSTLLFYVKVMQHKVSIDTTVKVSMQSPSGKYIWDSTATYTDTLTNTFGCDSILTFNVKVLQNSTFIDTSVCLFFKLSTSLKAFYQTGNFIDTLTNRLGGDSIVYIKLTILKSTAIIDTSFCNKILSPSGKFWLNNTGAYTDTLMNKHNCDSIITIRFTRLPMMDTIRLSACKPLGSPSGKFVMNETRWYTDTLVSSKGCDSILQIDYTQIRITDTMVLANCNAALSPSNKFVMQQSGWYTDTLITTNGCDSIIRINFTLLKSASSIVLVACDSLISPSGRLVFNAPGVYTDTITNAAGCDSIITINLTFSNSQISVSKSNDISCENQSAVLTASGGSVYVWQPSKGLSNTQISNPIASPNQTTQYTVIATDAYGCKLSDTISVYVNILDSVNNIPNVITPNNDGLNDCISAENIAQFNTCSFVILSRWGNVVWQTNNPKNSWCGTTENGQETAEGTYYYILKGTTLCNQKINSTGTITVIR